MFAGLTGFDKFCQVVPQDFYLIVTQQTYAGEITVRLVELDLLVTQAVLIPVTQRRSCEQSSTLADAELIDLRSLLTGRALIGTAGALARNEREARTMLR